MSKTVLALVMVLSVKTRWHQHRDISRCHYVHRASRRTGLLLVVMHVTMGTVGRLMNV